MVELPGRVTEPDDQEPAAKAAPSPGSRAYIEMLIRAAQLYYRLHLTQQQVADRLGITRSRVSRMLGEAERIGIVQISITNPLTGSDELERPLRERFGLKAVRVLPCFSSDHVEVSRLLGGEAADLIDQLLEPGMCVGIGRGVSVYWTVQQLRLRLLNATVVPLSGGVGQVDREFQVNGMVQVAASRLGGQGLYLYAPAVATSPEQKAAFLGDRDARAVLEAWSRLDLAVVGIGVPNPPYNPTYARMVEEWLGADPLFPEVVGDIGLRFFDREGRVLLPREDVLLTVPLEQLRSVRYVVGVAGSPFRARAVAGALRGGFVNVLVTDEETARQVLALA